jgi:prepilin-type N-terminal cleavage/methylation domain-containing protein
MAKPDDRLRRIRRRAAGFTLVELMVVIAIIMLLISILAPSAFKAMLIGMKAEVQEFISEISDGAIMFKRDDDHGLFPGQSFGGQGLGSEVLAEALWEKSSNNNGKLDVDNNNPPVEVYAPYKRERIIIVDYDGDGAENYLVCDPSSVHEGDSTQVADTKRAVAYYPCKLANNGTVLADTFYIGHNTLAGPQYLPDINLPENWDGGKWRLTNTNINRIYNYDSFLMIAPFRDGVGQRQYFMEYNVTNIPRD